MLAEKDGQPPSGLVTPVRGGGIEAAVDWTDQRSQETHVGYAKAKGFAWPGRIVPDRARNYTPAAVLPLNRWDFSKSWAMGGEFAEPAGPGSTFRYRYHARDLHLVVGLMPEQAPVRFRVTIDGAEPGVDQAWTSASMAGERCATIASINWCDRPVRCAIGRLR